MKILQIGLGNFGKNHLKAWAQLGLLNDLYIAEPERERWEAALSLGLAPSHLSEEFHTWIDQVEIVDIVTPTDSHHLLCREALTLGKDVFVEKPMTLTADQAREIVSLVRNKSLLLQVGYGFRYHPISHYVKEALAAGRLGQIRYLSGSFMGFKRPRADVGVTHTDGIHFLDLFNWILQAVPSEVYAVTRDHLGRGLEDISIVLLTYPDGTLAKVESGYLQPGRWDDKVVANAKTTKEIFVVGTDKTIEADYETGTLTLHDVHFEKKESLWAPLFGKTVSPSLNQVTPIDLIVRELSDFLEAVRHRREPAANAFSSGLTLALLIEAIYRSAKSRQPQRLETPSLQPEGLKVTS